MNKFLLEVILHDVISKITIKKVSAEDDYFYYTEHGALLKTESRLIYDRIPNCREATLDAFNKPYAFRSHKSTVYTNNYAIYTYISYNYSHRYRGVIDKIIRYSKIMPLEKEIEGELITAKNIGRETEITFSKSNFTMWVSDSLVINMSAASYDLLVRSLSLLEEGWHYV